MLQLPFLGEIIIVRNDGLKNVLCGRKQMGGRGSTFCLKKITSFYCISLRSWEGKIIRVLDPDPVFLPVSGVGFPITLDPVSAPDSATISYFKSP